MLHVGARVIPSAAFFFVRNVLMTTGKVTPAGNRCPKKTAWLRRSGSASAAPDDTNPGFLLCRSSSADCGMNLPPHPPNALGFSRFGRPLPTQSKPGTLLPVAGRRQQRRSAAPSPPRSRRPHEYPSGGLLQARSAQQLAAPPAPPFPPERLSLSLLPGLRWPAAGPDDSSRVSRRLPPRPPRPGPPPPPPPPPAGRPPPKGGREGTTGGRGPS